MARITVGEVRRWLRQAKAVRDWAGKFGLRFPWADEVYRLASYVLRRHRRQRRHHRGRVASLGLVATAVEKGRSHHG